jgi:DNA replication protein DnaC
MASPVESTPCPTCGGAGYLVEQVLGKPARARRCQCQVRCTRCHGTGYALVPGPSGPVAQPCACKHLDERLHLFNQVGIPAALAAASFEGFKVYSAEHSAAKILAEDFARTFRRDQPTRGFLLYGRPGGGKTHLLASTLRWLALEKGVASRYVEFMLLLSDMKDGFSAGRSHMEILRPLLSVPVLAIDELGKERGTPWEQSMLDELISRRFNSGLSTLFATNYFVEPRGQSDEPGRRVDPRSREFKAEAEAMTLAQRVGDRIYSRLSEMCTFAKLDPNMDFRKDVPGAGASGYWGR